MFRYLEKYHGKYRVLGYYDLDTNDFPRGTDGTIDDTYEDLYIPCGSKCVVKHTYDKDYELAYYVFDSIGRFHNVCDKIKDKYPTIDIKVEEIGIDGVIYFKSKDFDKIATIIKPKTNGARTKWSSKRNLPTKSIKIPAEDLKEYQDLMSGLEKAQKMKFGREVLPEFIEHKHIKRKFEESGLKPRDFIYDSGLWEEFVKFAAKKVKMYE